MDWIERMRGAMAYIEENLDGEIDLQAVARRAMVSSHLFARTFALIVDVPLSEYIRCRRLSRAAEDLQRRGDKVIDVALRYGYASPTAFQRAFVQFHGITPSQVRRPGTRLNAYPPLSFTMTIQGGVTMQYRIEEKKGMRFVGYAEEVSMLDGQNFTHIPQIWNEFSKERCATLETYRNGTYAGVFGAITFAGKPDTMLYWIAVPSERTDLAEGMAEMKVEPQTYAVFETTMADIQTTTKRIFSEWMPNSGYEHAESAEFEYYPDGDMSDDAQYMAEIWIPIYKA